MKTTNTDRAALLDNLLTHLCENLTDRPEGHPARKARLQTIFAVAAELNKETGR
jgi:hypothetical protein